MAAGILSGGGGAGLEPANLKEKLSMRIPILFLLACGGLGAQTGVITGVVVNRFTGAPVERAQVTLTRQDPSASAGGMQISGGLAGGVAGPNAAGASLPEAAVLSDAAGRYRFEGLEAGVYVVQTRRTGYFSGPGRTVRLKDGERAMVEDLTLAPPSILSGVVVDEDGEPVEGVQMQMLARRVSGEEVIFVGMGSTATDDRGRFRIATAQTGAVVLSARSFTPMISTRAPGHVYVTTYYPSTLSAAEAREVVLKPGEQIEDLKLQLRSSRVFTVRGRVLDIQGKPVANAGLHVRPKNGDAGGLGVSVQQRGAEGFEIRTMPPGEYTLVAHQFDGNQQRTASLEIEVKDSDLSGLELQMARGVKVTGTVEIPLPPMAQGGPTDIVPVEGMDHRESLRLFLNPVARNGSGRSYTIATKEDGSFVVEDVQPGRYEVAGFQYGTYLASVRVGEEELLGRAIEVREGMGEVSIEYRADGGALSLRVEGEADLGGQRPPVIVLLPVEPENRRPPFLLMFSIGGRSAELRGVRPGEYYVWLFDQVGRYDGFSDAGLVLQLSGSAERVRIEPDGFHEVALKVTEWPAGR